MDVKKCDKCGKIFDKNEHGSGYIDLHLVGDVKHADICEACAKDIVEYLFKPMSEVERWREVYDQVVTRWVKKYVTGNEVQC